MKTLGTFTYFLGIEVTHSNVGTSLCQHKYTINLLQEIGMLGCRPSRTPLDVNVKIGKRDGGTTTDKIA